MRRNPSYVTNKTPEPTSTSEWKKEVARVKQLEETKACAPEYTKKQKQDFKKMKARMKLAKKERKIERKRNRIKTESYHEYYIPNDDMRQIEQLAHHLPSDFDDFPKMVGRIFQNNRDLIRAALYIHQMAASTSCSMDLSITAAFVMDFAEMDMAIAFSSGAVIYNFFKHRHAKKDITTEALSDIVKSAADMGSIILESSFVGAIRHIILVAVGWKFFDKDMTASIHQHFGKLEKKLTFSEAIISILNSIYTLLKMCEGIWAGIPLTTIFLSADPIREALKKAQYILKFENSLYYGLPDKDRMCARAYMSESEPLLAILEDALTKKNPFSSEYPIINDVVSKLQISRNNVRGILQRGARNPPIGVVIHGPPGIGKSSVVNYVYQLHSKIKGRVFEPTHVFERVTTSQYWDGYDPFSTPYIHYSEVGCKANNIVKQKGDDVVIELTSVCDSLPYSCDMSDVKDKGKVYCCPELVVIDTNNPEMNIPQTVNNPAAYRRRFIYIEPIVKDEFKLHGTQCLDPSIPSDNYYDKWTFRVVTQVPSNTIDSIKQFHLKGKCEDDINALETVLTNMFTEKISQGEIDRFNKEKNIFEPCTEAGMHDYSFVYDQLLKHSCFRYLRVVSRVSCDVVFSLISVFISWWHACLLEGFVFANYFSYNKLCTFAFIILMFFYCMGLIIPMLIIFLYGLVSIDFYRLTVDKAKGKLKDEYSKVKKKMSDMGSRFYSLIRYALGGDLSFDSPFVVLLSVITTATAIIYFSYKHTKKFSTESSNFMEEGELQSELMDLEDHYNCGNSYERINIKGSKIWNTRQIVPSLHKAGLSELHASVMRNARFCHVITSECTLKTYCLGVSRNYALINRHALGKMDKQVVLKICVKGNMINDSAVISISLRKEDLVHVCEDVVLIDCNSINFKDIITHFPIDDADFKNAQGKIGRDDVTVSRYSNSMSAEDKLAGTVCFGPVVKYVWNAHTNGMCGLPVVAKRDSGSCIVGLHCAGSHSNGNAFAAIVLRAQILSAIESIESITLAPIYSQSDVLYGSSPHFKSPVRYEDLGVMTYYGCVRTPNMNQSSKLTKSIFCDSLQDFFFQELSHVRRIIYKKPLMKPVGAGSKFRSPYNYAIRKMNISKKCLDRNLIYKAVDIVHDQIYKNLQAKGLPKLQPLTFNTAVNGVDYDPYTRRIDMNKAAGFGTPGKKSDYCTRFEKHDIYDIYDEVNGDIQKEVIKIIRCYQRGDNYGPVFKAQLKDEPRDADKVAMGKTRIFFATPFAFLIVQRMFLAPFYTLMIEHCEAFYTAIGIDMHREAHLLYDRMSKFSKNILEGDYGGYDQSMPFEIGRGANTVVIKLLENLGYNEDQLQVVAGILSDLLFPHIEMIGEMLTVPGLQPSGKYATAEDNSIRNLLIMVYIWLSIPETEGSDFFKEVLPVTYGDDVLAAVSEGFADTFNAITFSRLCEELTDLTFTTSDKGEVSTPFLSPSDMSFLKRNFRYHNTLKRIVAPLQLDSIYKTLEWFDPSPNINESMQYESICNSSLRELYFHFDQFTFQKCRSYMLEILQQNFPECVFELVNYDSLTESLCSTAIVVQEGRQRDHELVNTESECFDEKDWFDNYDIWNMALDHAMFVIQWSAKVNYIDTKLSEFKKELSNELEILDKLVDPMPGMSKRQVYQTLLYSNDPLFRKQCDEYYEHLCKVRALQATIDRLWAWLMRERQQFSIVTESDIVAEMTTGEEKNQDHRENVVDVAGSGTDMIGDSIPSSINVGQINDLDMSDFLRRPLAVTSFEVAVGSNVSYNVDIWNYFLSHPSVRAKLRNYAYLRGKMHIRVAISGTPFHYGKVLVSYQPLAAYNKNLPMVDAQLSTDRILALTYLSQSRYARVMDIKDNQPLEMELPFISPQPVLRLFNKSPLILGESTPYNDAYGFGKLYIQSINNVQCASSTPSTISVFVYAYMSDVQLGAPTGTVITIGTESEMDERKRGPVEKVATRASEIAYQLTSVPVIAPFARASAMALEGVGALSSLFGFSVPTMENEPIRTKPQPYQNGSHVIGYDTGKRITLDPKQELSIDPRVVQIDEDDMSLSAICSRESLLDTFTWSNGDLPLADSIWMAPINPGVVKRVQKSPGGLYYVAPTALAFAATPFDVWRGDIQIRLEIVCSKYHRGKLAIYFEPNVSQNIVIDTILDMNKQYVHIIDIQDTQDVTFNIKWAFPRAWAKVLNSYSLGDLGNVGFLGTDLFDYANGYIAITPFTKLQSPDSSDISVNVYISSDDMQFNQLIPTNMPTSRPVTESGILSPIEMTRIDLNTSSANIDHISEEHYGEVPVSFRSLLKRFCAVEPATVSPPIFGTGQKILILSGTKIIPDPSPKYDGLSSGYPSLFGYLRYAYIGLRGGVRHRLFTAGNIQTSSLNPSIARIVPPSGTYVPKSTILNTSVGNRLMMGMEGSVTFIPETNGGIEFEAPFYTNNLFGISFSDDPFPNTSIVESKVTRNFEYSVSFSSATVGEVVWVGDNVAAGDDFSFMGFQGSPFYEYSS
ncbi:polyprotein [Bivalve RNA virus G3]|uniref:polyprotein n=1 Tax=Bivalve RNA virus G3 TaxID=1926969 RepID=UPI00092DA7DE|nr:polyprotein [Bivalve RNA virus G3]APJ38008.1 polyprotein [Bivalve RNA virus G3]